MPLGLLARDSIADLASLDDSTAAAGSSSLGSRDEREQQQQLQPPHMPAAPRQPRQSAPAGRRQSPASLPAANPQQAQQEAATVTAAAAYHTAFYYSNELLYGDYNGYDVSPARSSQSSPRGAATNGTGALVWTIGGGGPSVLAGRPWWRCCLFPWIQQQQDALAALQEQLEWEPPEESPAAAMTMAPEPHRARSAATGDDDTTDSGALGERLSEKERQALRARLRLPEAADGPDGPDGDPSDEPHHPTGTAPSTPLRQRGLLDGLAITADAPPARQTAAGTSAAAIPSASAKPLRPILKRRSVMIKQDSLDDTSQAPSLASSADLDTSSLTQGSELPAQAGAAAAAATAANRRRRSLFPQYAPSPRPRASDCSVHFAPMARVVTIPAVPPAEKGDVWWTKTDYEAFRRTGRIITRAMLEGGSEIWLTDSKESSGGNGNGSSAATTSINNKGPISFKNGDKWWHRFGHSRRGLEHVVSFEEGRQRQQNVRTAIASVLEEQTRQARYSRRDAEKLRAVSLSYTTWARDLALAAGQSDADAVRSSFAEDRKSREFYLLKMAGRGVASDKAPTAPTVTYRRVPAFMLSPATRRKELGAAAGADAAKLDAHTAAQISFRRAQMQQQQLQLQSLSGTDKAVAITACSAAEAHQEPIHDDAGSNSASLKQRAKGFSMGDDQKMDMGAVLSGLGPVVAATTAPVALAPPPSPSAQHHADVGTASGICGSPASSVASTHSPVPQAVST